MSGWSVIHSGWVVFMDGKAATLTGEAMPSAMIVSEEIHMDTSSQGVTGEMTGIEKRVILGETPHSPRIRLLACT